MVADFNTAPVAADGLNPLLWGQLVRPTTGEEVTMQGLVLFSCAFVNSAGDDVHERSRAREITLQGICGVDGDLIGDEVPVFGLCALGKKGGGVPGFDELPDGAIWVYSRGFGRERCPHCR
jgi:hypothetical protein